MEGTKFSPKLSPEDAYKFLVCNTHIGTDHVDFQAGDYIFKRREDGLYFNMEAGFKKLLRYPLDQLGLHLGEAHVRCTRYCCYQEPS